MIAEPYVLSVDETRGRLQHPTTEMCLLAGEADTDGAVLVFTAHVPPGDGPPRHVHEEEHEMLLVLSGELTVEVGDEPSVLGPGSFAFMPIGVAHTFANLTDERVDVVGIATPGGIERLFNRMFDYFSTLDGAKPDPTEIAALQGDNRTVGPPLVRP